MTTTGLPEGCAEGCADGSAAASSRAERLAALGRERDGEAGRPQPVAREGGGFRADDAGGPGEIDHDARAALRELPVSERAHQPPGPAPVALDAKRHFGQLHHDAVGIGEDEGARLDGAGEIEFEQGLPALLHQARVDGHGLIGRRRGRTLRVGGREGERGRERQSGGAGAGAQAMTPWGERGSHRSTVRRKRLTGGFRRGRKTFKVTRRGDAFRGARATAHRKPCAIPDPTL